VFPNFDVLSLLPKSKATTTPIEKKPLVIRDTTRIRKPKRNLQAREIEEDERFQFLRQNADKTNDNEKERLIECNLEQPKRMRWTMMEEIDLNGFVPDLQQAVKDLLTPGQGTNVWFIETYLSLIARAASALPVSCATFHMDDTRHLKHYVENDANFRMEFASLLQQAVNSPHKLTFIPLIEYSIQGDYEENAHASIMVIDKTRQGQTLIVHFDSDRPDEEDGIRECINNLGLGSCVKYIYAETMTQDEDNGDCALFTCAFAHAYAKSVLHPPATVSLQKDKPVDRVVVQHSMSPEALGYGLRSHVFQSTYNAALMPSQSMNDISIHFC
jgi:hypothetical protein